VQRNSRSQRWIRPLVLVGLCSLGASACNQATAVQTREQRFQASDGTELHYSEVGVGPTIVFVPGWTMPGYIWKAQMQYFAARFHAVALDPRAQGSSQRNVEINSTERRARDINVLIELLKSGPVVLVGWSLAVPEVLTYAEQFGGSGVRGYVLVDGFAWDKPDPQFVAGMLGVYKQLNTNRREFTESLVRKMFRKKQQESLLSGLVEGSMRVPEDSAIASSVSAISRADWTPAIRKIDRPLMVACQLGMKEMAADLVQKLVPSVRTEFFEDAGHALFVDDADRFNRVLDDFVAHLPAAAGTSVSQN